MPCPNPPAGEARKTPVGPLGQEGSGFESAYRFPGMNRVMQAAGRVIRTEEDRGVVLLIDQRFLHTPYRKLFPGEWSHFRVVDSVPALHSTLQDFWARFP